MPSGHCVDGTNSLLLKWLMGLRHVETSPFMIASVCGSVCLLFAPIQELRMMLIMGLSGFSCPALTQSSWGYRSDLVLLIKKGWRGWKVGVHIFYTLRQNVSPFASVLQGWYSITDLLFKCAPFKTYELFCYIILCYILDGWIQQSKRWLDQEHL